MKTGLLLTVAVLMTSLICLNAQTVYGPDYFEPYTENFEDGEAQGWVSAGNSTDEDWTVNDNSQLETGAIDVEKTIIYDEAIFRNYKITAEFDNGFANHDGVIFNYQDDDNYYAVIYWPGRNALLLREKVDGDWDVGPCAGADYCFDNAVENFYESSVYGSRVDSNITSDWQEQFDTPQIMEIVCNEGGVTSVYFNDELIFEEIDLSSLPDSGKVGFFTQWSPVKIYNVTVSSLDEAVDIEQNTLSADVSIYPNPVKGNTLTIDANNMGKNVELTIYSITGKLVYTNQYHSPKRIALDVKNTLKSNGMYIVKLSSEKGIYTKKISY